MQGPALWCFVDRQRLRSSFSGGRSCSWPCGGSWAQSCTTGFKLPTPLICLCSTTPLDISHTSCWRLNASFFKLIFLSDFGQSAKMDSRDGNVQQNHPTLCKNGCGFYSNAGNEGLCSVCYKDIVKKKQAPPTNMPASFSK